MRELVAVVHKHLPVEEIKELAYFYVASNVILLCLFSVFLEHRLLVLARYFLSPYELWEWIPSRILWQVLKYLNCVIREEVLDREVPNFSKDCISVIPISVE